MSGRIEKQLLYGILWLHMRDTAHTDTQINKQMIKM